MTSQPSLPDRQDVLRAAERIAGTVLRTPVISRASLNEALGFEVFFKCENQQRTGSFKFRGASNAVRRLVEQLAEEQAEGGERPLVTTHSSGNHGAALARAASAMQIGEGTPSERAAAIVLDHVNES